MAQNNLYGMSPRSIISENEDSLVDAFWKRDTNQCNKDSFTTKDDPVKIAMCYLCDCCLPDTIHTCQVFFYIYIGVLLLLAASIFCYRHYDAHNKKLLWT